ncbi:uncharacterized protein LOC115450658 [Manduca sexta]|uniref:uncharacterized protein LOC115450658 n=1 Tax=Manduca sexta TaxID=7130 RepID=UPI0018908D2F|nr:uncharacterized protein LOC115450658 [Manduca sexta]
MHATKKTKIAAFFKYGNISFPHHTGTASQQKTPLIATLSALVKQFLEMTQCCVKGCKSNSRKNDPKISFHRLPKKLKARAKWIENIGRRDWNPTSNSYICSLHFEENCINHTLKVPRVKDNCFPTIFPQGIGRHIYEQNELNTTGCLSQQHVIAVDELNSQASTSKEYPYN